MITMMNEALDSPAWALDDTGLLQYGKASPGVARQYIGAVGEGDQPSGRGVCQPGDRDGVLPGGLALVRA